MAVSAAFDRRAWMAGKRIIGVFNGKGGVGKTTLCSSLAYLFWKAGKRVLVLDFNTQGNLSRREFNLHAAGIVEYKEIVDGDEIVELRSALDDDGEALVGAIVANVKFQPVEVPGYPGLFIGHGGSKVASLFNFINGLDDDAKAECVTAMIRKIIDQYDVIIIDSPPENPGPQRALLSAVRYAVFPARTDGASLEDGLTLLGREFLKVQRRFNPYLTLLGGMLFATTKQPEQGPWNRAIESLGTLLGDPAGACPIRIPYKETVADQVRAYRLNVIALEALAVSEGWPRREIDPIVSVAAAWADATKFFIQRMNTLAAVVPGQGTAVEDRQVVS